MSQIEKAVAVTFAAAGLFVARAVISFLMVYRAHMDAYRMIRHESKSVPVGSPAFDQTSFAAISILGQQHQAMTGFILGTMDALLKEFVFSSEKKEESSVHEISCKSEYIEIIRKLMDESSERVVKELASWATSVLAGFDLKFEDVSLEPDQPGDIGRSHDILVIFRVTGNGEDALRFQAAASRKLSDLVSQVNTESTRMLRPQVRWS